jgi:tetratricopeptide (TPR) repeat protein
MSGILRNSMRVAVIALICAGAMSVAWAQEEWKTLSGEALWEQAGVYEQKNWWGEQASALTKYLEDAARPGAGDLAPERVIEARFRLARAEFQAARSSKDFARFDTLLAAFETSHTVESARIQTLRQLWTEIPLTKDDWTEGERRLKWYLENYPNAPEAVLVKKDLARKKWQDGDQDGAVADLRAILAGNPGNTFLAPVAGALGDCECEREGGYEAQAAALEGFLKDHAEDYPGLAPLHLALGMAYLNLGRPAEVGAQMAYVIEHDFYGGHAHEAVRVSAQALDKMGLARDGLAYLEEVVRRYADTMPRFEFVIQERADFQLRLDGPDAAIASLKAHITSHPALVTVGDAVYVLSRVVMKAQGPAAAIAEMERMAAAYGLYAGRHAQSLLAGLCACNGDPASAAKYCPEFVEKYPDSPALDSVLNMECFHLYQAGRFEEAQKAAEARLQAGKTRTRRDIIPAFVLSYTLRVKARNLGLRKKTEEAAKALAYGREVFDIYLQLTDDEYIVHTMSLYTVWKEYGKALELGARYLAAYPDENAERDWIQLYIATCQFLQLLADPANRDSAAKAAETLDDLRTRQRGLSYKALRDVLDYDPSQRNNDNVKGWAVWNGSCE